MIFGDRAALSYGKDVVNGHRESLQAKIVPKGDFVHVSSECQVSPGVGLGPMDGRCRRPFPAVLELDDNYQLRLDNEVCLPHPVRVPPPQRHHQQADPPPLLPQPAVATFAIIDSFSSLWIIKDREDNVKIRCKLSAGPVYRFAASRPTVQGSNGGQ